ncbi:hypothetical protein BT63DRAFT_428838 [Microthyrium microscopicum]|uniref:Zn(2)-C6 fungal-type domain-containing protein n=1 Tax=Microthyrium microscopicum TaxID=703497 RepID=A0A6A6U0V5_9PEZI|nr:hypothetical protein BT63DRAFT_428838 [Microthyrium microscopicum]
MPRQYHTKSRLGCLTCKRRKVRCDQTQPICNHCTRLGKECVYTARASSSTEPAESRSTIPQSGNSEATRLDTDENISDHEAYNLELMHQWITVTSISLTSNETLRRVWREEFPKLAFSSDQNRYLLHGMLALAALHKARTSSEDNVNAYFLIFRATEVRIIANKYRLHPASKKASFASFGII